MSIGICSKNDVERVKALIALTDTFPPQITSMQVRGWKLEKLEVYLGRWDELTPEDSQFLHACGVSNE